MHATRRDERGHEGERGRNKNRGEGRKTFGDREGGRSRRGGRRNEGESETRVSKHEHGLPMGRRGGRGGRGGGGRGLGLEEGHRGEGRAGRRGKRFSGDQLRLMVLGLLEAEDGQHGYQLIRTFAERSAEAYSPSPGVLYPLLTMLQDMELVEERESEGKRRSFGLTYAGRAEVEVNRDNIDALFAQLALMAEKESRFDAGPVNRARMNLRAATRDRLSRPDATEDLTFKVAAILDEATQKIERL